MYTFGDLHGNLTDLNFFGQNLWKFGMALTAGKFLFLGDYVDRGKNSVECIAYLFAQKVGQKTRKFMFIGFSFISGIELIFWLMWIFQDLIRFKKWKQSNIK